MAAARGSKQKLLIVKEATFGTTPTDPTLLETPVVSFSRNFNRNAITSDTIRSHPFVDKIMKGQLGMDFDINVELGDDIYDHLLDIFCGTTTWAANVLKITDSLQGFSMEAQATDLALYDQAAGAFLTKMDLSFPAEANGKVTAAFTGMAKSPTPDAAVSIIGAGTITPAPSNDPFTFQDATVTLAAAPRPVTSLTISAEREVTPLLVLGSTTPREYVPALVRVTGQLTMPLDDALESARLLSFGNVPIVAKAGDSGATNWRQFTIPGAKYTRLGRQYQDRGVILQVIDWEAQYDSASATAMSITRTA